MISSLPSSNLLSISIGIYQIDKKKKENQLKTLSIDGANIGEII
jgi:hypothetical protein